MSHLARASQVQRLLERYIALAPVFIGGPSSTSLDLLPPPPSAQYSKAGLPSGPWEGLGVNPPPLVPIGLHQQQHNGLSHLQVKKASIKYVKKCNTVFFLTAAYWDHFELTQK